MIGERMNVRRRRLRSLFAIFSGSMVAALIAIALVAVRAIAINHRTAIAVAGADLDALSDAAALQGLLYQKGFVAEYFLTGDQRWLDELQRATPEFDRWLANITRAARTPESARAATDLAAEYGRYDADRSRAIAEYKAGDHSGATQALVADTARAAHLRELANHLIHVRRDEVAGELAAAEAAWRHALWVLAAAVVLAILAATAIGYLLARRVARPLYELVLRAESAAGGARVEVDAGDEIGALSEHVTRLARQIESSSAELAAQRARLVQAEKMSALGEMATAVAHEVLNPLTGVKTAMQLLARENPSPDVRETAASVDAEIRRIEGIARRLVSFARPLAPSVQRVDLDEIVERVILATRVEAGASRARVERRLDGVRALDADPDLLTQLLVNLAANACQASPEGGAVRISARREGSWSVIDVADEGPGIAAEIADRLFTPFATTRRDGHGLGLAVSQNIAVAHGGRIEARSEPGRGATFSVWLPESRQSVGAA